MGEVTHASPTTRDATEQQPSCTFGSSAVLEFFVASCLDRRGGGEDPWLCDPGFRQVCLCRGASLNRVVLPGPRLSSSSQKQIPGRRIREILTWPLGDKYARATEAMGRVTSVIVRARVPSELPRGPCLLSRQETGGNKRQGPRHCSHWLTIGHHHSPSTLARLDLLLSTRAQRWMRRDPHPCARCLAAST